MPNALTEEYRKALKRVFAEWCETRVSPMLRFVSVGRGLRVYLLSDVPSDTRILTRTIAHACGYRYDARAEALFTRGTGRNKCADIVESVGAIVSKPLRHYEEL